MKKFRVQVDLELDELIKLERWFKEQHRLWSGHAKRNFKDGEDARTDVVLNRVSTSISKPVVVE